MTTLFVLGSGSRGNCFAVAHGDAALLVDAGFHGREMERRADACGLKLDQIVGIILTHEHADHVAGAAFLARRLTVPVLTAPATWQQLAAGMEEVAHVPVRLWHTLRLGPFSIEACRTCHDAAEPLAVAISTPDGARIGVAYDLGRPTAAVRYLLRGLSALVIEANHDEVMLRTSAYPPSVRRRIAGSGGHLSNRACGELLKDLAHPDLALIVLAHVSEQCNSVSQARAEVSRMLSEVGFGGELHVALQDEPLAPLPVRGSGLFAQPSFGT